jgi:Tfp pilus assembly protein FimT
VLTALSLPAFASYLRATAVSGAAREMRTALRRARQLAITRRQPVCVRVVPPSGYAYLAGGCAGTPLALAGTTASGAFRLATDVVLSNAGPDLVFTATGGAAPAGQLTLRGTAGDTRTVTVSPAGRIVSP